MPRFPNFRYEKPLWRRGYQVLVGLDEVGRGAWAGPLVVGAVAFPSIFKPEIGRLHLETFGIDDSKKLSPRTRNKLSGLIKQTALAWSVAEVSVAQINRLGLAKATQVCFRKAVSHLRKKLSLPIDFVLIDAFYISHLTGLPQGRGQAKLALTGKVRRGGRQLPLIKGDTKSISIAAASIIAKVYRDKLMQKLSRCHRAYGWGRNKGYGTPEHQKALSVQGLTRWHRRQFVQTGLGNTIRSDR